VTRSPSARKARSESAAGGGNRAGLPLRRQPETRRRIAACVKLKAARRPAPPAPPQPRAAAARAGQRRRGRSVNQGRRWSARPARSATARLRRGRGICRHRPSRAGVSGRAFSSTGSRGCRRRLPGWRRRPGAARPVRASVSRREWRPRWCAPAGRSPWAAGQAVQRRQVVDHIRAAQPDRRAAGRVSPAACTPAGSWRARPQCARASHLSPCARASRRVAQEAGAAGDEGSRLAHHDLGASQTDDINPGRNMSFSSSRCVTTRCAQSRSKRR
jgi:hypothetical protein